MQQRNLLKPKEYDYRAFHTHNADAFLKNTPKDFFLQNIAFLSDAGMPCISDPGVELVRYLQLHNLPFEVVGGISAVTLVVAFSGIVEKEFCFLGFPPHKTKERKESFIKALKNPYPIVFYESPHRLMESLEMMAQIDAQRIIFLAKELTKKHQQTFKGSLEEILAILRDAENTALHKGEWAMVIDKSPPSQTEKSLTQDDVLSLEIPPKIKAKILAKINGGKVSDYYHSLTQ